VNRIDIFSQIAKTVTLISEIVHSQKTASAMSTRDDVKVYILGFKQDYTIMILETPKGYFLRLKHGDKRINFQLDLLNLLKVAEKIKSKMLNAIGDQT